MYCNQKLVIKWGRAYSKELSISNGVKQGEVISALFFCVYLDDLFFILKQSGYGCYIGNNFTCSFGYANDIILLSPTVTGMQHMLDICKSYANQHHIILFNASKSCSVIFTS